jgi:hypothetical protein
MRERKETNAQRGRDQPSPVIGREASARPSSRLRPAGRANTRAEMRCRAVKQVRVARIARVSLLAKGAIGELPARDRVAATGLSPKQLSHQITPKS